MACKTTQCQSDMPGSRWRMAYESLFPSAAPASPPLPIQYVPACTLVNAADYVTTHSIVLTVVARAARLVLSQNVSILLVGYSDTQSFSSATSSQRRL
ncbi:LOW QUALITY PROTEIN: hypothetical protein PoB_004751300 [Plakobranchus ocellatus]|uniref:Uncharacterized protein n=1 Tax=Plakobranchus ocellatus TaxID=259542 RepID=A0AAV4BN54_9GAST|nr:LOW QUALITY PROTEIN: hypothetical protein PoB_004751300 [Plakobranchus ocellatus]